VRYATNVVHCIVKNINIVPVVLVVYYYGWIGVLLSLSLECGQSWVGGL
jgi:glucose-6-phosphate-specific signal transduction histidine kinase